MKYTITPQRATELIEGILGPFEIRNKIDDSWEGKWWKLHGDVPQRKVIVWDRDGDAVFTFDRMYNELSISSNHVEKIISYIPLSKELTKKLLIKLFIELLDNKFPVEHVGSFDLSRHDKEPFEDDEEDEN